MTDTEFLVMDELYFVIKYEELLDNCDISSEELVNTLNSLFKKEWIRILIPKVLNGGSDLMDVEEKNVDINSRFQQYYFMASKAGLMAHNSTS